jgi:hypothetical protein
MFKKTIDKLKEENN